VCACVAARALPLAPLSLIARGGYVVQMAARVRNFEALLGAGVVEAKPNKHATLGRIVESLALSSGFARLRRPSDSCFSEEATGHLRALHLLLEVIRRDRADALLPFVKRRMVLPADDMSRVNELVLQTLASLIRFADYRNAERLQVRLCWCVCARVCAVGVVVCVPLVRV
jgi:hypothetical protein